MNKKTKHNNSKNYIIGLTIALSLLATAIIVNGTFTVYLWQQNDLRQNQHLASLIINAVDSFKKPLVIEGSTGKQYIPEAKLVLPPQVNGSDPGPVLYQYSVDDSRKIEQVGIASKSDIAVAKSPLINATKDSSSVFDAVPKLQSCSRGVQISFAAEKNRTPAAIKLLNNGKTAYFYTEDLCKNPRLLEYVQKINSY